MYPLRIVRASAWMIEVAISNSEWRAFADAERFGYNRNHTITTSSSHLIGNRAMPGHQPIQPTLVVTLPPGYRVVAFLGAGQFGKVYKAEGQGGHECAFKVIEVSPDNVQERNQALKEFRAIRTVRNIKPHRHLLEYLGVWLLTSEGEFLDNAGELEDADLAKLDVTELFIQMPVAVKSLEERLKECQRQNRKSGVIKYPGVLPGIPIPELLPYMRGVAEALDHLHSKIHPISDKGLSWVMHRDIKPANLLIDRKGDVLVADYGVARAIGANVRNTQSGAGSPIYTAPEQFTKKVEVVDPASDQYSLAISYYEMRTGSYPFRDDIQMDQDSISLAHKMGWLDFAKLPAAEQTILKRATNRTVSRRYPSCVAFVDELWKANGQAPQPVWNPAASATEAMAPPSEAAMPPEPAPGRGTRPKIGSLTDIELGTKPEIKVAPAERPAPAAKPSGTLGYGETVRPPYAPPTFADAKLPLAEPIEDESPEPTPWRTSTPTKKSHQPLWLAAAGVGLAGAIGIGVYVGVTSGPKPGGTGTELTQVDGKTDSIVGTGSTAVVTTTSKTVTVPVTPTDEFAKNLEMARSEFQDAIQADVANSDLTKIATGVKLLKAVPVGHDDRSKAQQLAKAWEEANSALAIQKPSLADADDFDKLAAAETLPKDDRETLNGIYGKLRVKFPTAATHLTKARETFNKGESLSKGRDALKNLLELKPSEPVKTEATQLDLAWSKAETFDMAYAAEDKKPASLLRIEQGTLGIRGLDGLTKLNPVDRSDILDFYRTRLLDLVERFSAKPNLGPDAAEWAKLKNKLPTKAELDSPWRDLLLVESEFLVNSLSTPAQKNSLPPLPEAKAGADSPQLAAYRKVVAAERGWHDASTANARREAADKLATSASSDLVKNDPARRRAFAQILARVARDLKQPAAAPDAPYAVDEQIKLARKVLQAAETLLAKDAEKLELLKEVRTRLLVAVAFPQPDRDAAKSLGIDASNLDEVANSLEAAERPAFWLAVARTRDYKTEAGIQSALIGYERTVANAGSDLAFAQRLAGFLGESEFVDAIPEGQRKEAGTKLYLPLARQLRKDRVSPEKSSASELVQKAALLAKNPDWEALAGIYANEAKLGKLTEADAERLAERANQSTHAVACLGLVQFKGVEGANESAKLALLTRGGDNLHRAVGLLKKDDPEKLLDHVRTQAVLANVQLGLRLETSNAAEALKCFDRVFELVEGREELTSQVQLPRGKCLWNLARGQLAEGRLKKSKEALLAIKKSDAEYTEARLYLAYHELYDRGLLPGLGDKSYEDNKRNLVGILEQERVRFKFEVTPPPSVDKLAKLSDALDSLPTEQSKPAIELLEWRACLACARARAAVKADPTGPTELCRSAFAALKDFEKADPLTAELRRAEFVVGLLLSLGTRAKELAPVEEFLAASEPRFLALGKLTPTPRLPGFPHDNANRVRVGIALLHLKARAIATFKGEKSPGFAEAAAALDALKMASEKLSDAERREIVTELELLGLRTALFAKEEKAENAALATASAKFGARVMEGCTHFDPKLDRLFEHHQNTIVMAVQARSLMSDLIQLDLNKRAPQLKIRPELIEEAIVLDRILEQSEILLGRKQNRTPAEEDALKAVVSTRSDVSKFWFEDRLDAAIKDVKDPDKAKQWTDWKNKRFPKP